MLEEVLTAWYFSRRAFFSGIFHVNKLFYASCIGGATDRA